MDDKNKDVSIQIDPDDMIILDQATPNTSKADHTNLSNQTLSNQTISNYYVNKRFDFSKLNVTFNGKTCPLEFLTRLEELKPAKGFTDEQCFLALPVLLTDIALKWFRARRIYLTNWSHFKIEFLDHFTPRDFNYQLEYQIRTRRQKTSESLSDFIVELMDMSAKLPNPLLESTLLDIAKHNMLPQFSYHLIGRGILSLNELIQLGKEIESYKNNFKSLHDSSSPSTVYKYKKRN